MKTTTRWMTRLIAVCLSFAGFMTSAQATLVSTEQVAASEGVTSAADHAPTSIDADPRRRRRRPAGGAASISPRPRRASPR